jgi:ABC-type multidrug transport system permease subunit
MPASLSPRVFVSLTAAFIAAVFVFAGVYTATQHNPTPHQLRVGIVAPDLMVGIINTGLKVEAPGYFSLRQYPSEASLTSAIKSRKVYGGYVYRKDSGLLLTASAAGKAAGEALVSLGADLSKTLRQPLVSKDVAPLTSHDSQGLSSYTYQYGVLVPSFVFAVLIFMFGYGLSLYWRLGLSAAYSLGAGIIGALTVDQIVGALPGHFFAIAALGALYAATAVLVTWGMAAVLKYAGLALAGVLLILVGNSTGGGSINQEFLPDFFRNIGQVLPNGAFIRAVRDTEYFGGANTHRAILVVALWAIGGLALVLAAEKLPQLVARGKRSKAALKPSV